MAPLRKDRRPKTRMAEEEALTSLHDAMDDSGDEIEDDDGAVAPKPKPKPFPFLDLPAELRLRIYQLVLVRPESIDLDPENCKTIVPVLKLFRTCRQIHEEAYPVFYGQNTFRIFATTYRFFSTKHHLISRLPIHYREAISSLELRLGPGWTRPPKTWNLMKKHGLHACTHARVLKIFVELDPSQHDILSHFLPSGDTYTRFCVDLLRKITGKLPSIGTIEFDGWDSVKKDGSLMAALIQEAKHTGKKITYGPEHGWTVSGVATPTSTYEDETRGRLIACGIAETLAAATLPFAVLQA